MNGLESDLRRLPEPALPEGLAAGITARIAALDNEGPAGARVSLEVPAVAPLRDRLAWAAAFVGVTVGVGAQAYRLVTGEATLNLGLSGMGDGLNAPLDGVVDMLPASPAVALLAAGLLLYLAGLFAPLRGTGEGG